MDREQKIIDINQDEKNFKSVQFVCLLILLFICIIDTCISRAMLYVIALALVIVNVVAVCKLHKKVKVNKIKSVVLIVVFVMAVILQNSNIMFKESETSVLPDIHTHIGVHKRMDNIENVELKNYLRNVFENENVYIIQIDGMLFPFDAPTSKLIIYRKNYEPIVRIAATTKDGLPIDLPSSNRTYGMFVVASAALYIISYFLGISIYREMLQKEKSMI